MASPKFAKPPIICRWYAARTRERFRRAARTARPDRRAEHLALRRPRRVRLHLAVEFSRWRFSPARSPPRLPPAMRWPPNRRNRRRWSRPAPCALLHQAGVPRTCLHCCPATARSAQALVHDPRIAGVAFTGGTETARLIAASLAARPGPIVPFIAETGGINAMIVDSSALPEQVVADVLHRRVRLRRPALLGAAPAVPAGRHRRPRAAHAARRGGDAAHRRSAGSGDRCRPGDRRGRARERWNAPRRSLAHRSSQLSLPPGTRARQLLRAARLSAGPCKRAASRRYSVRSCTSCAIAADRLDAVLDAIDATGYGLTLGIHSRDRSNAAAHRRAAARRQHLCQPQPDRRRGRRAAIRRPRAVGHRAEGRRADHAVSFRRGASGFRQHRGGRRQRSPACIG